MPDKKFINLDQLVETNIVVELGGVQYEIQKPTVLGILKVWKDVENQKEMAQQALAMIDFLYVLSPKAKEAKAFDNLNVEQINVLMNALTGEIEREVKTARIGDKPVDSAKKKLISESPSENSSTGTPATN